MVPAAKSARDSEGFRYVRSWIEKSAISIPVVGIGASAGGLEAFKALLSHLPAHTGLAFVFVQHLDPKHPSNLTEILSRISSIPVQQASDGLRVEADHLYVISPDTELEIAGDVLRMTRRVLNRSVPQMTIDHFLRSLAQECGSRAIGVILSGAGTDGAAGLEAVKSSGGVTFAQDPGSARFSSMPQAAMGSGCVDLVLPPEAIAAELTKLGHHAYLAEEEPGGSMESAAGSNDAFGPILALLLEATGIDFALYRESTIQRRIARRLALRNLDSLDEYLRQLEQDPAEVRALHRDLLISITRFFRDPESFEQMQRFVFPLLVQNRPAGSAIRIWVPGCATGEEAYSIAICLDECFHKTNCRYPVQIFASDVSSAMIERARSGKYGDAIAADIGPERINRYFSKIEGGYQISKALREMCIFSKHDLTQDPPFSKLDLISCRNVLIFFGGVRRSIIARFHYALNPRGFLVLGPSETESGGLFTLVADTSHIYSRNETPGMRQVPYLRGGGVRRAAEAFSRAADVPAGGIDVRKETERALLSRYRGSGVLVDETLEILEIVGRPVPYFQLPAGRVSLNLLKLLPETRLLLEVQRLVQEAAKTGEAVRQGRVTVHGDGTGRELNVEVIPLSVRPRAFLVLFEPEPPSPEMNRDPGADPREREIAELKQDLSDARERLLSVLDEHQSADPEGQNRTEEVISANEELQSLNEELETAKEELQSTNEELTTVNEELRSSNAALTEARDFALLIIESVPHPYLVLDMELRIRTANPAFYRAFQVTPEEAKGQFLYAISQGAWEIPSVRTMLERVLPDRKTVQDFEIEQVFPGLGQRTLVLSARQLDGLQQILLGIDDVTERKQRTDATLHESEERFRSTADTAPVMIWVAGISGGRTFFNKSWLSFTGRTVEQESGQGWSMSVHPEDLDGCLKTYSSSFLERRDFQMEYRLRRADGEYRWLLDNGVPRFEQGGVFVGYIGSCVDITDVKRAQVEQLAKQKLESVGTLASGVAHDFNNLMGGVLAQADLALQELSTGSPVDEELQSIRAIAIRGAEIVRQLLIYAGRENELLELVDVSRIVQEMIELLKVSVSKQVALETDFGKDLPAVRANAAQLRQVVMNLILNASEAMGDRTGVIRVTTRLAAAGIEQPPRVSGRLPEGDRVLLQVSDTGPGMPAETQARVFDPFFTTKATGHGLGLAVVQGIVRSIGGAIRLTSAPGKGSTFEVSLPSVEHKAKGAGAISSGREETAGSRPATILVVEDEDPIRQAISKMSRQAGFSVIEAGDGSAAFEAIRAHPDSIDLLLLDITLPGTSSREVLDEAKRLRPDMPVIISSAYSREMAARALDATVEHFIRKPFRLSELMNLVRQVLA